MNITPKAQEKIKAIKKLEETTNPLRLKVIGGGCSGLSYKIEFDETKAKDINFSFEGFDIVIDPKSFIYIKDSTLDYRDGLEGKGFIFENPLAKNTCGCGESFSI